MHITAVSIILLSGRAVIISSLLVLRYINIIIVRIDIPSSDFITYTQYIKLGTIFIHNVHIRAKSEKKLML